jgi:hypothetical protein
LLTEALGKVGQLVTVEGPSSAYAAYQVEQMQVTSEQLRTETACWSLRCAPRVGKAGRAATAPVVESAGMVEHRDFAEQETDWRGRVLRPDPIVRLAGGKQTLRRSPGSSRRTQSAARLRAHARHLRDHVDAVREGVLIGSPSPASWCCSCRPTLQAALEQEPALFSTRSSATSCWPRRAT